MIDQHIAWRNAHRQMYLAVLIVLWSVNLVLWAIDGTLWMVALSGFALGIHTHDLFGEKS